ncbi:MAG: penicillin acylase family protein [Acidobacteriota bacterium]
MCALLLGSAVACAAPETSGQPDLPALAEASLSQIDGEIALQGITAEVEVLRDDWGVAHIYAQNVDDLFFAQGFVAAQDRLWQLEMWRRWMEGRSAELAGADRIEADRIMRLLAWREGLTDDELASYHPQSRRILEAFAAGINAYVAQRGDNLPVEFQLTGLRPTPWTAETSTLRTTLTGVGGSLSADLRLARRVAEVGAARATRPDTDPYYELVVPEGFDPAVVTEDVVRAASVRAERAFEVPLLPRFAEAAQRTAAALRRRATSARGPSTLLARLELPAEGFLPSPAAFAADLPIEHRDRVGSNNWVISGALSDSGLPMLANDPHRQVDNPALRYLAHLDAPGWRVIGSGEPALPGIAIGHNERIAWGLTIVGTDQIDIFVEQLDPADPTRVLYDGTYEPLRVETETIAVRGEQPREVRLEFSRHGPILYKDVERGVAYAVRSFAQEPGTAPYLGSLRVDQAQSCREFLDAMNYWKSPSENMICGDIDGNIAWRASALTPNRTGPTPWYGRLPVPGSGDYAWDGFRDDLPEEYNPERGYIATANHNIQPPGYHPPLMFKFGPPYPRYERLVEMIEEGGSAAGRFTVRDFSRMQHDAYSAAAAALLPVFRGWSSDDADVEWARAEIADWDAVFDRASVAAALYITWRDNVSREVVDGVPDGDETSSGESTRVDPQLQIAVERGLTATLEALAERLGDDRTEWRWGRLNTQAFRHPLIAAFDLPEVEKSGGAGTVYANGATFREIFDLSDWDVARATTAPGQSGQPASPYYGDQIVPWADGEYFPLMFSREGVERVAAHRLVLRPPRQ